MILVTFVLCLLGTLNGQVVVSTTKGSIQGKVVIELNNTYRVFKGVPFAKPPVGSLRFEAPVDADPWMGILSAIQFKSKCMQVNMYDPSNIDTDASEDCLYLNIFTRHSQSVVSETYPVMMFIHGGAFVSGSASDYPEQGILTNLVSRGVIVVTINYRLGPLGFWTTETERNPGNLGIRDQIMALGWISREIRAFGGNPNKVTIFGESAGSGSVSVIGLAAPSELWQQAIMMSGTSFSEWSLKPPNSDSGNIGRKFAGVLNCSVSAQRENAIEDTEAWLSLLPKLTSDSSAANGTLNDFLLTGPQSELWHLLSSLAGRAKAGSLNSTAEDFLKELLVHTLDNSMDLVVEEEIVKCLKSETVDRLFEAQLLVAREMGVSAGAVSWAPRVDGLLITEGAMQPRKANKKIMLGTTKDEWGLWDLYLTQISGGMPDLNKTASSLRDIVIPSQALSFAKNNVNMSIRAAQYAYVDAPQATSQAKTDPIYWFRQGIQFSTAVQFTIATYFEAVSWQSAGNDVFLYSYDFLSETALSGSPWRGVVHASELPYVFSMPMDGNITDGFAILFGHPKTISDTEITNAMGTLWTNFAKFGNPTPSAVQAGSWTQFDPVRSNYFSINYPTSGTFDNYNAYDVAFGKYLRSLQKPMCI